VPWFWFEVIRGGGVEYETDVSFAGLHQLVGPLSDDLRRLPRSSRVALEVALGLGSGPAPERLAVLNASLALFRQAASRGQLLIVIDDLHWLDRASGAAVGFVGRRLRDSRIGLLGAIRPDVGGFFERAGLPEYEVAPLSQADAMGLLARQFVHLPTRVLRRVADEAQGNPLALLEFGASAGAPRDGGQPRATVISGMSREVRALYHARIERLPEPTRHLLLLAVLDGSGDLGVLAAASGPGGLDDLGPAERDHLIVVDDRAGELASDDEAPALFAAALARPGIGEWPFELARVQLAHGERLRRLRRTRDARSQLAAACDGFERLGARPWVRRAATELGATGATRQRVNGGGASLTLQEREVARLAATGMTNREIAARLYVAPRTVSAHLYRIFPKLGITSRAALRDALNAVPGDAAP
jgi:DNA-binding CsgD family transcriptional regulator